MAAERPQPELPPVFGKIRRVLSYWRVALGCGLTLLICGMPTGGFTLFFVVPAVLIWLIICACKRELRRNRPVIVAWLLTFAMIGGLHYSYASEAQANAENALAKINAYRIKYGQFPAKLEDSGFIRPERSVQTTVLYWLSEDKTPFLCRMNTFIIYNTICYNFQRKQWEDHGD